MATPITRIELTTQALEPAYDSSAAITSQGAVNFYRSGYPSTTNHDTGFKNLAGETRSFEGDFGTGGAIFYAREGCCTESVEDGHLWMYLCWASDWIYMWRFSLSPGQATVAPVAAQALVNGYVTDIATPLVGLNTGYGFVAVTRGNGEIWRWDRSTEAPDFNSNIPMEMIVSLPDTDIQWVDISATAGEIWGGGIDNAGTLPAAAVARFTDDGELLQYTVLDAATSGDADYGGFAAHPSVQCMAEWGDQLIVVTDNTQGLLEDATGRQRQFWYTVGKDGTVTNITHKVFVDGLPYAEFIDYSNGDDNIIESTQMQVYGNRILVGKLLTGSGSPNDVALLGEISGRGRARPGYNSQRVDKINKPVMV